MKNATESFNCYFTSLSQTMSSAKGCCVPLDDVKEVDDLLDYEQEGFSCLLCGRILSSKTAGRHHVRNTCIHRRPTPSSSSVVQQLPQPSILDNLLNDVEPMNRDIDSGEPSNKWLNAENPNFIPRNSTSQPEILFGHICLRFSISQRAMKAILHLLKMNLDFSKVKDVASVLKSMKTPNSRVHRACKECDKELRSSENACNW
jgi:hypothetical protein